MFHLYPVSTKLLLLLGNFNCFIDVSTPNIIANSCNDITFGDLDLESDGENDKSHI